MYLLGFDIGSSSIKASLVDAQSGNTICTVQQPGREMEIHAIHPGWAEQQPEDWWKYVCQASRLILKESGVAPDQIKGIGIAYQMHGLVMLDDFGQVLRPSIIWCDSRAVDIGQRAFEQLGPHYCLDHFLNSPGNFTASKLRWVIENEPETYRKCFKFMLPGDYIAYKLTGELQTTISGLSEGVLWDFVEEKPAFSLMEYYGIQEDKLPEIVNSIGHQGRLKEAAAAETGLLSGTPVTYRAGDQPNNALSLKVLNPGEIAATGGTSGVVYGVVDRPLCDAQGRVNGFAHINHMSHQTRVGILLCINGSGIQYSWLRKVMGSDLSYAQLESLASQVVAGSDGLIILPFGNGAERMLQNRVLGAHMIHLDFNRHGRGHLVRAALEGVAFAFVYGMEAMKEMGISIRQIRVGDDNLFQSDIFSNTVSSLTGTEISVIHTRGATGAALAAGVGCGVFADLEEALQQLQIVKKHIPGQNPEDLRLTYGNWKDTLEQKMKSAQ